MSNGNGGGGGGWNPTEGWAGGGGGRIYTAIYTATDGNGNQASAAGFVVVRHDQGGSVDPLAVQLSATQAGTLVSWSEVPSALSYDVISGRLGNITPTNTVIDLGPVVCIEDESPDASTAGAEDPGLPEPGTAFFYLVEYYDGTTSTFGTESASLPRAPGPGSCGSSNRACS